LSDHVEKELGNYIHAFGEAHIVIMLMRCDKDTEWEITNKIECVTDLDY